MALSPTLRLRASSLNMVTMMTEPTLSVRTLSNTFITNFARLLAIVVQDTHCLSLQSHQMLCTAERQAQLLTAEKQANRLLRVQTQCTAEIAKALWLLSTLLQSSTMLAAKTVFQTHSLSLLMHSVLMKMTELSTSQQCLTVTSSRMLITSM